MILQHESFALVHAELLASSCGERKQADLELAYGSPGKSIVVFGHVHRGSVRTLGGQLKTLVHAGSVGLFYDGDPRAAHSSLTTEQPQFGALSTIWTESLEPWLLRPARSRVDFANASHKRPRWPNRALRSLPAYKYNSAMKARVLAVLLGSVVYGMAQQPLRQPDLGKQRAAMQKLSFLVGSWSGDAHVQRGLGEVTTLKQTENVEYKLGGLVLVIEGTGQAQTDQQPSLQALGIISYDDLASAYHIRAWNDGRFLESDVHLLEDGKSLRWGFGVGDIRSSSLLQMDKDGQWTEKAELIVGTQPPRRLMDLVVRRK